MIGFRSIAITSALGVAGLGMVSAGAHAVFTTQGTSTQTITAGTPSVAMTGSTGSSCTLVSQACKKVTLPGVGPTDWTFLAGPFTATVTNTGIFTLSDLKLVASVTDPNSYLAHDTWICLGTEGIGTGGTFSQYFWGSLSNLNGQAFTEHYGDTLTTAGTTPTSTSAPTDNWVIYYAAGPSHSTPCGSTSPTDPGLNNGAQGESTSVSLAMNFQG